jgi:hypothetical protein
MNIYTVLCAKRNKLLGSCGFSAYKTAVFKCCLTSEACLPKLKFWESLNITKIFFENLGVLLARDVQALTKPLHARIKPLHARVKPLYALIKPLYALTTPLYALVKPLQRFGKPLRMPVFRDETGVRHPRAKSAPETGV